MSEPDKPKEGKTPENEKPFATRGQWIAVCIGGLTAYLGTEFFLEFFSWGSSSQKAFVMLIQIQLGALAGLGLFELFKYLKRKLRAK